MQTKGFHLIHQQLAIACWFILQLVVTGCSVLSVSVDEITTQQSDQTFQPPKIQPPTAPDTNLPQITGTETLKNMHSDVPLLTEAQLQVDYWLSKVKNAEVVLQSFAEIQHFNQHLIHTVPEVIDVFDEPEIYPDAAIRNMLLALSHPSTNPRFNKAGTLLTEQHWQHYEKLLALEQLPTKVVAKYALVTSRGSLRTYPTTEAVFSSSTDQQLDRFQETAVFPGEALQILHLSRDQQWAFVRHYHYNGWLAVEHFAVAEKSVVQRFVSARDFILVTGVRATTNTTPEMPQASAIQLEMGVKLPRVRRHAPVIHGQNAGFSYVVQLPIRQPNGQLQLVNALIARNQDLSEQYLPLTKANILRQSFKFLGERYGWGHDLNARDCSGFIGEVYRSFGFILPRNTSTQGQIGFGAQLSLADATSQLRKKALQQAQIGDLIFIPGHVMLVLGHERGETFVIHDVAGLHYFRPDGSFYHSMLNGVSITPLSPLQRNQQQSYLDSIYMLKSFSREFYADPTD